MKIAFVILFAAINLALIFKIDDGITRLKYLKLYGLGIPGVLITAVIVILLMKVLNIRPDEAFKEVFFGLLMSILAILLMNIAVIGAGYLIDMMLKFHAEHNAANVNRFPVSFVAKNHTVIKSVIKVVFFLASLLIFYGIWLGKK